ncbi:MAG: hypothetical protein L0Y32_04785, partial [Nevskiales bacterium]|nr:hypothetical protein [Nevskiales bacterium]
MSHDFSKAGLVRFLDTVARKGMVNANTVSGWRAACTRILEDVADGDDVRKTDPKTAVIRYNNRHSGELASSSLKEYERRLGVVINEFANYTSDPAGYKRKGRGSTRAGKREKGGAGASTVTTAELPGGAQSKVNA